MDAFYASVEQNDHPELRGRPVAVGGDRERGVVAAASYEARKFGVKSAMPSVTAHKMCPQLVFVPPRFARYKEISVQIRKILFLYTDLVEPLSLDEAYLDVTENKRKMTSATVIAREIKQAIKEATNLTASAGISYNKFLAKMASDKMKPDGLFCILPEEADEFLKKLPVTQFHGIGKAPVEKMKKAGIFTGADLRKKSAEDLTLRFGKMGRYYYEICRGIDTREVTPNRDRKSISVENTFEKNLMKMGEIHEALRPLLQELFRRYQKQTARGKTITIKVKYGDFQSISRSHTCDRLITSYEHLSGEAFALMDPDLLRFEGVRLLGVGLSNFQPQSPPQLTLKF